MTDLVGIWEVSLSDGVHTVKFEHGTTTGKRVVIVDGDEVARQNWMFKLVGKEFFKIGKTNAFILIEAASGFAYEYTMFVDGKPLKKFIEDRKKTARVWTLILDGIETRIVLEKDTMDVWVNGEVLETAGEFADDGTETHFSIRNHSCFVKAVSSGKRREGIIHTLFVDGQELPECVE